MKHIQIFSSYQTYHLNDNEFFKNYTNGLKKLVESRGIPNFLKVESSNIMKIIISKIANSEKNNSFKSDTLKMLNINIFDEPRDDFYGTTNPIILNNLLEGFDITLKFRYIRNDIIMKHELHKLITHELLHCYEILNRFNNNIKDGLEWNFSNIIRDLRNSEVVQKNKFLNYFSYVLYLNFTHEINARIAEVYSLLLNEYKNGINMLYILKTTKAWQYSQMLKNFDPFRFDINYNDLYTYFNNINKNMVKSTNKSMKIFKKVNINKQELDNLLSEYKNMFNKKGLYFEKKLYKILSEIKDDIELSENILYDINKNKISEPVNLIRKIKIRNILK